MPRKPLSHRERAEKLPEAHHGDARSRLATMLGFSDAERFRHVLGQAIKQNSPSVRHLMPIFEGIKEELDYVHEPREGQQLHWEQLEEPLKEVYEKGGFELDTFVDLFFSPHGSHFGYLIRNMLYHPDLAANQLREAVRYHSEFGTRLPRSGRDLQKLHRLEANLRRLVHECRLIAFTMVGERVRGHTTEPLPPPLYWLYQIRKIEHDHKVKILPSLEWNPGEPPQ